MTTHHSFASTEILLESSVLLQEVGEEWVSFIEVPDIDDVFNIRKNPFYYEYAPGQCKRLLEIPRRLFDDFVEGIDVSDKEVVWMFHTGRCGSTLWCQVFYNLPGWSVISENETLSMSMENMFGSYKGLVDFASSPDFEKLVVAIIKVQVLKLRNSSRILWKTTNVDFLMIPIIRKHFSKPQISVRLPECTKQC